MKQVKSLSNLEFHCLKGMTPSQKAEAKKQIKKFEDAGYPIPWGIIRKATLIKITK